MLQYNVVRAMLYNKKTKLSIGVVIALSLIAGSLFTWQIYHAQTVLFSQDDAAYLEKVMNSPDKSEQRLALAPESRASYDSQNAALLPKGITAKIDIHSFEGKDNSGRVRVKLSDGFSHYLYLTRESGQWFILRTEKLE